MQAAPPPYGAYDAAFSFWRRVAQTCVPVGESRALVNMDAPFVFANALWYPHIGAVAEAPSLYAEQGVLASVVLGAPCLNEPQGDLHAALKRAGFAPSARYALRLPEQREPVQEIVTEQVSWAQTRALGEVIAAVYDLGSYAVAVGQSLALALQLNFKIAAFIAYDAKPVGASVTLETKSTLTAFMLEALTDEARAALTARLSFEAGTRGKRALLFSQTSSHSTGDGLEVWTQTCS